MRTTLVRRILLVVVVLVSVSGIAGAVSALTPKPDFGLVSPQPVRTINQGDTAIYAVNVVRSGGFTGAVSFTSTAGPAGSHITMTPNPDALGAGPLKVTVTTAGTTPSGVFFIGITGSNGALHRTITLTLAVIAATPPSVHLAVSPSSVSTAQGTIATYTVTLTRYRFPGIVQLSATGLPAHSTGVFNPKNVPGNTSTFTVTTTSLTPLGSYNITIRALWGVGTSTTIAHLTVTASHGLNFTIAGAATPQLAPGVTGHFDLSITNPNSSALNVTSLTVTLVSTTKSGCTLSNFSVGQFSGAYPLVVPANSTRTLTQLGVPQSAWPTVTMIDLPVNQDVCKTTGLNFLLSGQGTGN